MHRAGSVIYAQVGRHSSVACGSVILTASIVMARYVKIMLLRVESLIDRVIVGRVAHPDTAQQKLAGTVSNSIQFRMSFHRGPL